MPFSHDGFSDRVSRYPIPHLSAAEILGLHLGIVASARHCRCTGATVVPLVWRESRNEA